ncbi:uncharacterized protein [Coffea arabica]|uniref:Uncharacterized protein isoform X3 n=1 Tax=Coffea arabica TaxID=13443 RepID=A0ABM4VF42_COFAR
MDTVGLALPEAVVAVSKLMGSEGFSSGGSGGVGAAVGIVQAGRPEGNSVTIRPSFDACSHRAGAPTMGERERNMGKRTECEHLVIKMPVMREAKIPPEPAFQYKVPDTGRFVPNGQLSNLHLGDASEELKLLSMNASQSLTTNPEAKQLHRRSGKVSGSNSGGSKRSRIVQLELSTGETGLEDMKGSSSRTGYCPAKFTVAEKSQMPKQRNNSNAKRNDKRNGRIPKSRCDSFCLKNGLVSFSSVAGGGNFVVYGSKSDIFDGTKPVDELPLSELLDGSYNCPSLVKDKGKAVENSNENLLHLVRKAASLIWRQSPVHSQNPANINDVDNQNVSMGPFSIGACPTSRMDGEKEDSCTVNQPSNYKDSCGHMKPLAVAVDSPLCPPKDILERLALPPSKDLDSLLLDAVRPASSSRTGTDLRLGKTVFHRTGLPPFSWSHNSSGHVKSGSDTVKLSANRTTCPGRWVKVGNTLTPVKGSNLSMLDLKSLTYNHRLVPSGNLPSTPLGVENASSICLNISSREQGVSSSAAFSASQDPSDELSPRLLAAAQTLYEIASHSTRQNSHEMMKWLKQPSQKTMKACTLKLSQKSEKFFVPPKASIGPDNLVKVADGMFPSKKLRLSADEKTDAVCHIKPGKRAPTNWSAPRSIRSSPSKLFRDSVPEMKNYNRHIVNKSYMMPPPSRVADKACNSRQKLKKIVPMDWNSTASDLD